MSKRILVMEDEKDNRQIIRDMLGGIDCEITEAEDAQQALAAIAKERPDLILMGIHLPIMNGYTVTRQIKANPALRSIPVIAITSHALNGEEHVARAAGCDDYVPEPYSPTCWQKYVNTCSNRSRIAALHMSAFGGKADIGWRTLQCPLLTHLRHWLCTAPMVFNVTTDP